MDNKQKTIFSGIKPSGELHLGNYLGAINQWVKMQQNYDCIFCVVDYHAITVYQDPEKLRERIFYIAKIYIASGIDPEKSVIFKQSDVKEHTELAWILNCTSARMSDLNKMTQYKDKAGENQENVSVGLFDYPALMAADILLYDADLVPVGEDQVQHVELTRTLAKRFNNRFGHTFKIPEAKLQKESARIMGLDDPTKKMSKSSNSKANYISLTEDPEKAVKKIKRATTDSNNQVKYDPKNKPGISNLLCIYSLLSNIEIKTLEKKYADQGYGQFKNDLSLVVKEFLINFQNIYNDLKNSDVEKIFKKGKNKSKKQTKKKIKEVKKKIGII